MDDRVLKHLEFVQNTINRMSTNSFIIKGWAITLVGIILGINKLEGNYIFEYAQYNFPVEIVVILVVIILFWLINAYFLQQERRYISIYSKTIEQFNTPNSLILDMNFKNYFPSNSNKFIYWTFAIASCVGAMISVFSFGQIIFKIIASLSFTLISLFSISYIFPEHYLCKYWSCLISRTIISVYGTMIVLLLLINHSMFNTGSKNIEKKVQCKCVI